MFCIIPFKTDDTRIILSITIKHNFIFIKQVKFSELTLDMFRMLQTLEREPQEDLAQIYDASPAPGRVPFVSFLLKNEEFRLQRLRFDSRLQIGGPKQSKNENEVEKFFMPFTIEIQTLHNLISVVRIVKCRLCQTLELLIRKVKLILQNFNCHTQLKILKFRKI